MTNRKLATAWLDMLLDAVTVLNKHPELTLPGGVFKASQDSLAALLDKVQRDERAAIAEYLRLRSCSVVGERGDIYVAIASEIERWGHRHPDEGEGS
jgi:hypothetical protein